MCGIVCVVNSSDKDESLKQRLHELASRIRHRGPDEYVGCWSCWLLVVTDLVLKVKILTIPCLMLDSSLIFTLVREYTPRET